MFWFGTVCARAPAMRISRFQDLIAWQLARALERLVFAFTDNVRVAEDGDFCRQIRRSSSSAPRNMAEGFGRFWPAEFSHKMHIAVGELEETQDHLDKALEQHYIDDDAHLEMYALADRSIGAAVRFIRYLDGAGHDWKKEYTAKLRDQYRQRRIARAAARTRSEPVTSNPAGTPPLREEEPTTPITTNRNDGPGQRTEPRTRTINEPEPEPREPEPAESEPR